MDLLKLSNKGFICIEIAIIIFIIFIIGIFIFIAFDSSIGELRIDTGIIIDKNYREEYTTTSYTNVNGINVPQTYYHPESYEIEIKLDIGDGSIEISKEKYQKLNIDDEIKVKYKRGRWSKAVYIKDIL